MSADSPSIYLGNINPGEVSSGFLRSMLDCRADGTFSTIDLQDAPPYLDIYRNIVTKRFMESEKEEDYLLFVDSDIEFTVENVRMLYSHADPAYIVGGAYFSTFEGGLYSPVATLDETVMNPMGEARYNELVEKYQGDLIPVEGLGTGFMMIPREILKRMDESELFDPAYPYFSGGAICGIPHGEDYVFCQRLIHGLGIDVFLDPSVRVKHKKPAIF